MGNENGTIARDIEQIANARWAVAFFRWVEENIRRFFDDVRTGVLVHEHRDIEQAAIELNEQLQILSCKDFENGLYDDLQNMSSSAIRAFIWNLQYSREHSHIPFSGSEPQYQQYYREVEREIEEFDWRYELGYCMKQFDFEQTLQYLTDHHTTPFEYLQPEQINELVSQTAMGGPELFMNPLPGGRVTSDFGSRPRVLSPDGNRRSLPGHFGVDISTGGGASVIAAREGIVIVVGANHRSLGNYLDIEHPWGEMTRYAHLGEIFVEVDNRVKVGQRIGIEGNTGISTGPHLHFEIRPSVDSGRKEAINPIGRIIERIAR